jgi:hypothetical protein
MPAKDPRTLLSERMYYAVMRELLPGGEERAIEEVFKNWDQRSV